MPINRKKYPGREQTYIKHLFLAKYLEAAAYKTMQGGFTAFNYVDGFAGPWNIQDKEKYSDTSFYQALRTLENVRRILKNDIPIRLFLCEKNRSSVDRLRVFSRENRKFEVNVFEGEFENNLDKIKNSLRGGFTFTFIDPTGWNIESKKIFNFLKDINKGEFLINFMEEDIERWVRYDKVSQSFGLFLANPDWKGEFEDLPNEFSDAEKVLIIFKKKVKEAIGRIYLPHLEIKKSQKKRIKMKLVLGTNSKHGLEVFRDTHEKVKKEEIKITADGQFEEITNMQQRLEGIGNVEHQEQASKEIIKFLEENKNSRFDDIACHVMEIIPIRKKGQGGIKNLCVGLKKQRIIGYEILKNERKPQDTTILTLMR